MSDTFQLNVYNDRYRGIRPKKKKNNKTTEERIIYKTLSNSSDLIILDNDMNFSTI